jgi:hypothetical protein
MRTLLAITLLALFIRILLFLPTTTMPLVYDEKAYFIRSTGLSNILEDLIEGRPVQEEDINRFYGQDPYEGGLWPPLQMVLIALSRVIPLNSALLVKARLLTLLISALTVPFVYLIAVMTFGRSRAPLAAFLFAIYPVFIAWSHYLWSETLYIFLLLGTVYFAFSSARATTPRKNLQAAFLTGLFLGFGALTRATALPFFLLIPLWLVLAQTLHQADASLPKEPQDATPIQRRQPGVARLLAPLIIIVTTIVIILPWETMMYVKEGYVAPLSTSGGLNFYVGTSRTFIPGPVAKARITSYSRATGLHRDAAARALGMENIRENPEEFYAGMGDKLRRPWTPDTFFISHILQVIYPPIPPAAAMVVLVITYISFVFLLVTAAIGIVVALFFDRLSSSPSSRNLFLRPLLWFSTERGFLIATIIIVILLSTLVGIPQSRVLLPALALSTIFSAHGIQSVRSYKGPRLLFLSLIAVLVLWVISQNIQIVNRRHPDLHPSSYYQDIVQQMGPYFRTQFYYDQVKFYTESDDAEGYTISVLNEDYELVGSDGSKGRSRVWRSYRRRPSIAIEFRSKDPAAPLMLHLTENATNKSVILEPVRVEAWQTWLPTGIDGLLYRWETRVN